MKTQFVQESFLAIIIFILFLIMDFLAAPIVRILWEHGRVEGGRMHEAWLGGGRVWGRLEKAGTPEEVEDVFPLAF